MEPEQSQPASVLILDRRPARAHELVDALAGRAATTVVATNEALGDRLRAERCDLVLVDPDGSPLGVRELVDVLGASARACPVIAIGQSADEEHVVRALRGGACDYVSRGRLERLGEAVERALARARGRASDTLSKAARLQAVGELAGGIAHDLNNLLAIAGTFVDLGLENVGPEDPIIPDLAEARDALGRASVLTRRVLTFLRKDREAARPLDLNEVVGGLEGLLRCALGSRIQLVLALQRDLEWVVGDAAELEQVVLNLALNARDAIPDRGKVTVRTSALTSNSRKTMSDAVGRRVVLAVEDDGLGMDPDTLVRIFDPFFTTKKQGTGLGLSNARQIVTRHRGVLRVRSEPGVGTAFEVHLPSAASSRARIRPL